MTFVRQTKVAHCSFWKSTVCCKMDWIVACLVPLWIFRAANFSIELLTAVNLSLVQSTVVAAFVSFHKSFISWIILKMVFSILDENAIFIPLFCFFLQIIEDGKMFNQKPHQKCGRPADSSRQSVDTAGLRRPWKVKWGYLMHGLQFWWEEKPIGYLQGYCRILQDTFCSRICPKRFCFPSKVAEDSENSPPETNN